ncbi:MAG: hypothetical protein DMG36_01205 [Acidobacteria bacterium]|nr:MAG: hypothetical protein DMG36_01205 [Acidobacteriota bacterium]
MINPERISGDISRGRTFERKKSGGGIRHFTDAVRLQPLRGRNQFIFFDGKLECELSERKSFRRNEQKCCIPENFIGN